MAAKTGKGRLGRIERVTRHDTAALSKDVRLELAEIEFYRREGQVDCLVPVHTR